MNVASKATMYEHIIHNLIPYETAKFNFFLLLVNLSS